MYSAAYAVDPRIKLGIMYVTSPKTTGIIWNDICHVADESTSTEKKGYKKPEAPNASIS